MTDDARAVYVADLGERSHDALVAWRIATYSIDPEVLLVDHDDHLAMVEHLVPMQLWGLPVRCSTCTTVHVPARPATTHPDDDAPDRRRP